jgi:hypothetical protein
MVRLGHGPPHANGLTHLPLRSGDEVENLLSERYKRAPTIPALSQSAAQHQRVNCK